MSENIAVKPYYFDERSFSGSNQSKGKLGEAGFSNALSDFPILCNITYGKRQKDIDHLVFTCNYVVFNECKNTKESFQMYYSWFLSHVVDRFADGLPVAQFYARAMGYPIKNIKFTLTIPYLNTEPTTKRALKGLKISVIETKKQILNERDLKDWHFPIRSQFLSVINTEEHIVNNRTERCKSSWMSKLLLSRFRRGKPILRRNEGKVIKKRALSNILRTCKGGDIS